MTEDVTNATGNVQARVRVAGPQDAEALYRLNVAFNGASDLPEVLARRLADASCTEQALLAEVGCRVAGFAGLRLSPGIFYAEPRAEMTELYVEPEFRRHGVGRALVAEAERLARAAEAAELFVLTSFDNAEARALYKAMGFDDYEIALQKPLD